MHVYDIRLGACMVDKYLFRGGRGLLNLVISSSAKHQTCLKCGHIAKMSGLWLL